MSLMTEPSPTADPELPRALREFWAMCVETAGLIAQGVTPAVLGVWATLLLGLAINLLAR
ncbi:MULTISPECIES: hypothetical protein [Deinococcus]|uniref:Uncharacterized protein n=1 Tax=Deinococcus wulumuqiensis TaxID=980427 RepID=A0AAV4K6N8_9DEIO|nr:hypothetical protein [Deinococcus wulumuqiensis]QII22472.1 hypothetical protein G6R31_16550 [Deinococcus wulumuqiensis R12]GGI87939.1 hypothetical protein GCM10010914_22940 [Deinococcus wulumuqiensis]GGP30301.1 hypothetical protein GCM10008021_19520 [Deinococcus wulumuqiensis]